MRSDLIKTGNGRIELPTVGECLEHYGEKYFYVEGGIERYYTESKLPSSDARTVFLNTKVLPIKSDPTREDSDWDGVSDLKDSNRINSLFSGRLRMEYQGTDLYSDVDYNFNLTDFFVDSSKYNKRLSKFSTLLSATIYHGDSLFLEGDNEEKNVKTLLYYHGFNNIMTYKIANGSEEFSIEGYDDIHVSEICIGHKKVTYNGKTKDIVAIVVRGTDGTLNEWASNFDIGSTSDANDFSDWKTKYNHKGFDIATNRILEFVKKYVNKYVTEEAVYWVTGHSRGGAIANILSSYLINENSTQNVFAYTFAAPNTTISNEYSDDKYSSIFNIVNEDDFVPQVPMNQWQFYKYGRTSCDKKISSKYTHEWEELSGKKYEYCDNLSDVIGSLATIAIDREMWTL